MHYRPSHDSSAVRAEGTSSLPALSTHLHDVVGSSQQHSIIPVCALCASQILTCIVSVQVRGHVIDVDVEGSIWSGRRLVSGQRTKQFENHGVLVHLVITMCKILYDKPDCFSTLFAKILQFVVGIHSRIWFAKYSRSRPCLKRRPNV